MVSLSAVLSLFPFLNDDYIRMPPGGMALFPLTQKQNLQASWPSAVFSAMCSSAAFFGETQAM